MNIAYYGLSGSNTETAAIGYFGFVGNTFFSAPQLADVFTAVQREKFDYGVLPAENTTEGIVTPTYDLLGSNRSAIVGEHIISINHMLVANRGVKIRSVKRVYSHIQALAQCSKYLRTLGAEAISFNDTAASAKFVAERARMDEAAIANQRAAEVYGLSIIKSSIANSSENYTRFLIISATANPVSDADKTTLTYRLKNEVGALEKAAHCFSANGVNIIPITQRPIQEQRQHWRYNFYLDCDAAAESKNMQESMRMLRTVATNIRVLGSYRRAKMPA